MRTLGRLDDVLREFVAMHRAALALRLIIVLAPLAFLGALSAAATAPGWLWGLGALLAVATMLAPDSEAGLVTSVLLVVAWFYRNQDPLTVWTPVAAVALLVLHVATSAATRTPHQGRLPGGSLPRWTARTAMVAAVPVLTYAVSRGFAALERPGSLALTTLAGLALCAGVLAVRRATLTAPR